MQSPSSEEEFPEDTHANGANGYGRPRMILPWYAMENLSGQGVHPLHPSNRIFRVQEAFVPTPERIVVPERRNERFNVGHPFLRKNLA
jgi:hypothetical protein